MSKKELPLSDVYRLIEAGPVVMVSTMRRGKPDVMTMSWHMMIDFEPPLIACVISNRNYTFENVKKTKELVLNIPTAELIKKTVDVGNVSGRKVDKFKKFGLTPVAASCVKAPLVEECYANIECKVIDAKLATKYNVFIVEAVKAWIDRSKKHPHIFHHQGGDVFAIDSKIVKVPSGKK
jgi:flavin reductase (DIM6/NTAB) family NADH-FMN oxidoreductase RutF